MRPTAGAARAHRDGGYPLGKRYVGIGRTYPQGRLLTDLAGRGNSPLHQRTAFWNATRGTIPYQFDIHGEIRAEALHGVLFLQCLLDGFLKQFVDAAELLGAFRAHIHLHVRFESNGIHG